MALAVSLEPLGRARRWVARTRGHRRRRVDALTSPGDRWRGR